ncbi:MAG: G/U mismatch-specific DNA glycosylase [Leptolyngbyaceae cyanobacterium]
MFESPLAQYERSAPVIFKRDRSLPQNQCSHSAMSLPQKPSKADLQAAYHQTVPDIVGPELQVLFCGINASIYSAAVGHHFARPGNRLWKTLHYAGFTERILRPAEDQTLLTYGYGMTNIVARATARADELARPELEQGKTELITKVETHRPRWLAILGITAYRTAFAQRQAQIGYQSQTIGDTQLWVLPNPSGLNAHYQLDDLVIAYGQLYQAVCETR